MNFPGAVLLNDGDDAKPDFYWLPPTVTAAGHTIVNTDTVTLANTGTFTSMSAAGAAPTMFTYTLPPTASFVTTSAPGLNFYRSDMPLAARPWYWTSEKPVELVKSVWRGPAKTRTHVIEPKATDTMDVAHEPMTADTAETAAGESPLLSVASQPRARVRRFRARRDVVTPQRLTDLAVWLVGHERAVALRAEWCGHLAGESGRGLASSRQARGAARGFLIAAVRTRLQDAADLAWRPIDTMLASRELSNLVVLLATLSVAVIFIREGRLYGLADHLESVAVVWGAAVGLVHFGRQWRDVKPPERKTRRSKSKELARPAWARPGATTLLGCYL